MNTNGTPTQIVPLRFDLASLVRRSVASLYSHLITRPTGQALRLGIESQIGEMGELCLSILDFTQVAVLDYSCADETVAKLLLRFQPPDRPADAYFVLRGVDEHHREALEAVLDRHGLTVVELAEGGAALLGAVSPLERLAWLQLGGVGRAGADEIAARLDAPPAEVAAALERLAARRVVMRRPPAEGYYALVELLGEL